MSKDEARKITHVQHVCTVNDTNGNPRQCYVFLDGKGLIVSVEDEGYSGRPDVLRNNYDENGNARIVELPYVKVPPSEYRRFMKIGQALRDA